MSYSNLENSRTADSRLVSEGYELGKRFCFGISAAPSDPM
jgi:hypothetical protein